MEVSRSRRRKDLSKGGAYNYSVSVRRDGVAREVRISVRQAGQTSGSLYFHAGNWTGDSTYRERSENVGYRCEPLDDVIIRDDRAL